MPCRGRAAQRTRLCGGSTGAAGAPAASARRWRLPTAGFETGGRPLSGPDAWSRAAERAALQLTPPLRAQEERELREELAAKEALLRACADRLADWQARCARVAAELRAAAAL